MKAESFGSEIRTTRQPETPKVGEHRERSSRMRGAHGGGKFSSVNMAAERETEQGCFWWPQNEMSPNDFGRCGGNGTEIVQRIF